MRKLFSKMKKEKRGRRGFTVAEVIVAIAVIVIVSGSAMSFISAQARTEAKAVASIEATNIAENAIECFRYAKRNGGGVPDDEISIFRDGLLKLVKSEELSQSTGKYIVTRDGVTTTIELVGIDNNAIAITAEANGKEILTTSYTYVGQ